MSLLLLGALLVPASAPGAWPVMQDTFEGAITYKLTANGMNLTMKYMSDGKLVRQELEGGPMPGPMVILIDNAGETIRTLMPQMNMYMEMDMKQVTSMAGETAGGKLEKVGTSDVIAGIRCENYRVEAAGELFESCIASGMGWFMSPPGRGRGSQAGSAPDFAAYRTQFKDGALPLRTTRVTGGKSEVVMEATLVERKKLDAELFKVPAGFRKMTMPGGPPR